MYDTFHPGKYAQDEEYSCTNTSKKMSLFSHQKIVRDYLQTSSPYRGVLLFHGLGVGKTCASIAAAEDFISQYRKVFVLLPASLETNYLKDIMNCSRVGLNRRKQWVRVTLNATTEPADRDLLTRLTRYFRYSSEFIKKQTSAAGVTSLWIPNIPAGITLPETQLDRKPLNERTKAEKAKIKETLDFMINHRYTFVAYNGITKAMLAKMPANYFDNSFVVIDEAHTFISQSTHVKTLKHQLYMKLLNAKNTKFILLTGTPIINDPFELAFSLNLIRGPITRYVFPLGKDGADVPTVEAVREELKRAGLSAFVDYLHVHVDERCIELTFTPRGMEYVDPDTPVQLKASLEAWKGATAPDARVQKLIQAAFQTESPKVFRNESAYPMERKAFYQMFIDESNERPRLINEDLFMRRAMGLVSFYKTNDINIFPEKLPVEIHQVPLTDYQFEKYVEYRGRERQLSRRAAMNPLKAVSSVYRAYTRMASNFVFPKAIPRAFPHDIRLLRKDEIDVEFEDARDQYDIDVDEKDAKRKIADTKYKESLAALLPALAAAGDQYLTPTELETMYSPKMAALLKHLRTNQGKSLVYSQFNNVEGLGVLKLILKQNGWQEIELETSAGGWRIKNAETVLSPMFDGKRFIAFNPNRDITDILINMMNGKTQLLPESIRDSLGAAGYRTREDNFSGKWVSCLLISQSGAEGINLQHVRNVYILEPFWNQVRIDQVIGRAIRTCSHADLPPAERNVKVVMFVAAFTEDQKKRDMSISRLDKGYTSDQYILMMSLNKNAIINAFLNALMRASIDCLNNAQRSKIMKDYDQSCYAFPINAPPTAHGFTPSLIYDHKTVDSISQRLIQKKTVQGKVVRYKGKKYIRVDDPALPNTASTPVAPTATLYDYNAYVNAGVLVRASI